MIQTYYEIIDTPISIEEVTNKVIRRECGRLLLLVLLENLRKGVVRYI